MKQVLLAYLITGVISGVLGQAALRPVVAIQPGTPEGANPQPQPEIDVGAIERQLQSPLERDRQRALTAIATLAQEQPEVLAGQMSKWIKPLMNAKEYEWVDRAGLIAILHRPHLTSLVSDVQGARVEALLALGRKEEALVEAKRYYNAATMAKTTAAIDLVAEALRQVRAEQDPGVVTRFRQQQVAASEPRAAAAQGAGLPIHYSPAAPVETSGTGENVLRSIRVDASGFAEAIRSRQDSDSYEDLMARGNLFLLADRPAESKECFRQAAERDATRGKELVAALEGVARAIRAEDGGVGRANAFILALRQEQ